MTDEELREAQAEIARIVAEDRLTEAGRVISAKNRAILEGIKGKLMEQQSSMLAEMLNMLEQLLSAGAPPTKEPDKQPSHRVAVKEGAVHCLDHGADCPGVLSSVTNTERMIEAGAGYLLEAAAPEGREWDVILIATGLSKNGTYYPPETLEQSVSLFEGVNAYADHATEAERQARPERSIRDKVGRFTNVEYGRFPVGGRLVEGLKARFKVIAPWLRETLLEAHQAGEPDFIGFSIDAEGTVSRREHEGRVVKWVESIARVRSVDAVTDPAAGGRVVRLVASNNPLEGTSMTDEELAQLIQEQVAAALAQAQSAPPAAPDSDPAPAADPTPVAVTEAVTEAAREDADPVNAALAELKALRADMTRDRAKARLAEALAGATISDLSKEQIRRDFTRLLEARDFTDEELAARISEARDFEARLQEQFVPKPGSFPRMQMGDSGADKINKGIQGMFLGEDVDGIPAFRSIKEAYCRFTGQDAFDVSPFEIARAFSTRYDSAVDHKRLQESLSQATWGEIYADNLYVMMIRAYRDAPYNWRPVVSDIENVPDFETRHWARIGGYGNLSSVAEQATYPNLTSPTDEEVTYAISKYGGIDDVTFEAIVSDRFGAIRRIPSGMGRAAKRTLWRDVLDLVTTDNPTMGYDSVALFHADHGNTGTTALSLSGLDATQRAMRDQTAYGESAEILGPRNKIKYLIVPNELEQRANRLVNPSDTYQFAVTADTDTNIDPQAFKGKGIEVITYDHLTDATDWWAVADPREVPTVVVGFLNGQQEPELFVQDQPNVGSAFTADKVSYKVRIIYGMAVLDHRSFYRQVVA